MDVTLIRLYSDGKDKLNVMKGWKSPYHYVEEELELRRTKMPVKFEQRNLKLHEPQGIRQC
jgi:hypothetical protein